MRALSALARFGVFAFILILLSEVMSHPMWGSSETPPSTLDFAVALFNEWSMAIVVLRSEEHTSELQSRTNLVCRLLLEKKKKTTQRKK